MAVTKRYIKERNMGVNSVNLIWPLIIIAKHFWVEYFILTNGHKCVANENDGVDVFSGVATYGNNVK